MAAPHHEDVQRVLYVDDDPVSRRIFEQLGKSAHVAVDACGSLDEAFAFARQHAYAVIAADYSLRRWDGLAVLRELGGLQSHASLMLVTDAERKRELPSSLLKYVFVAKPIRRSAVLAQLAEALAAYEVRARTPDALLASAPILLLCGEGPLQDQLSRSLGEQGQGRLRVSRAASLETATAMLNSVRFVAALVDGRDALGARSAIEQLHSQAPGLPVVLVCEEPTLRERQLSMGRFAHVTLLRSDASPELMLHVLSSAVERAERQRDIATLSQNDLTTGARNRPTFYALLVRKVEQRLPFVLACFGVEGLSEINETLGHMRGDAVLATSVSRLTRELGPRAVVGRLGGSVFAVLAESLGAQSGAVLERTIRDVFDLPFDLSDSPVRVTVQVAAVEFPHDGAQADELLRVAERALREQKAQGARRRSSMPPPLARHS